MGNRMKINKDRKRICHKIKKIEIKKPDSSFPDIDFIKE
jgi:hypothetical protein